MIEIEDVLLFFGFEQGLGKCDSIWRVGSEIGWICDRLLPKGCQHIINHFLLRHHSLSIHYHEFNDEKLVTITWSHEYSVTEATYSEAVLSLAKDYYYDEGLMIKENREEI